MLLTAKRNRHSQGLFDGLVIVAMLITVVLLGCQRGDIRISPVIQGQPAPHAGYNIGPELYVQPGTPVPVTGAVIWIRGLDPNDLGS